MIALTFADPAWLFALPLIAVPIVIHLLNRRRHRRVPWAAMTFLLAAARKRKQRMLLEHWIVLLLRTLAVLLLVLFVAGLRHDGLSGGGARVHHWIVLDDTASMAQRDGARSSFELACERAVAIADRLEAERSGDRLTLTGAVALELGGGPIVAAAPVQAGLAARVRDALSGLSTTADTADWTAVLTNAGRRDPSRAQAPAASGAGQDQDPVAVHLVTDLCRADWLDDEGRPRDPLRAAIASAPQTTVFVVGSRDAENLGIVDVRPSGRVLVAGMPIRFEVDVRNHGMRTAEAVELGFTVDGRGRTTRVTGAIAPGATQTLAFDVAFDQRGPHAVVASLAADRFAVDDRRAHALDIRDHSEVLVVDGRTGVDPTDAASFYLVAALDPGGETRSGVVPTVIPYDRLGEHDLSNYDVVFLCDVPALRAETAAKLAAFGEGGGGVVVFVGDRCEPASWRLHGWRDGEGFLPAPFDAAVDVPDASAGVVFAERDHPLLQVASASLATMLARTALVRRYSPIDVAASPLARTVLRIGDEQGPPFLVHRRHGRGEVALCAVGADVARSRWPVTPAFLILVHELHRFVSRPHGDGGLDLTPRGTYRQELDPARERAEVVVRPVDDPAGERTFAGERAADGVVAVSVAMSALPGSGVYEVRASPIAGPPRLRWFASNPIASEGRLRKTDPGELRAAYGDEALANVTFVVGDEGGVRAERDPWRWLVGALFAFLIAESLLALRAGRS